MTVVNFIGIAAATVTAIGVLWRFVLHPAARAAVAMEEIVPMLRDLTDEFKDTPHAFEILDEIVKQFRTDHGSSLRDVVNRLEESADDNKDSAEALRISVEEARELALEDRAQLARLVTLLDSLEEKVGANTALLDVVSDDIKSADLDAKDD